jgi:hypothetical protein
VGGNSEDSTARYRSWPLVHACHLAIAATLCGACIVGHIAYNWYRIDLVRELHYLAQGVDEPISQTVWRRLDLAAALGCAKASKEQASLERVFRERTGQDPLLLWLGVRDLNAGRTGTLAPESVWTMAREGNTTLEAEEMAIAGTRLPNRHVATVSRGDLQYVTLYWQHNYLSTPLVVPRSGQYRVTVQAQDCPPVPLRLRVTLDGHSEVLIWEHGDYAWRSKSTDMILSRGMTSLSISYDTPPNNVMQNASIDYIMLEFLDHNQSAPSGHDQ